MIKKTDERALWNRQRLIQLNFYSFTDKRDLEIMDKFLSRKIWFSSGIVELTSEREF